MAQRMQHEADREQHDPKRAAPEPERAGGRQGGIGPSETETVDRDALHQADYGGTRDEAEADGSAGTRQGGVATDGASGGGREPTVERDHDPDGDRTGL